MRRSLQAYKKVNIGAQAAEASPHKIVQMLLGGAIDKLLQGKLAMEQRQIERKGQLIGRAIDIVAHLQAALDFNQSSEISENLNAIYDYMIRRMAEASANNDTEILMEVVGLLKTIKEGWDAIPSEHHHLQSAS